MLRPAGSKAHWATLISSCAMTLELRAAVAEVGGTGTQPGNATAQTNAHPTPSAESVCGGVCHLSSLFLKLLAEVVKSESQPPQRLHIPHCWQAGPPHISEVIAGLSVGLPSGAQSQGSVPAAIVQCFMCATLGNL